MKTLGALKAWLLRIKGVESLVAELHAQGHEDDQPLTEEHLERIDRELHPPEDTEHDGPAEDPAMIDAGKQTVDADTAQPSPPDQGGTPPGVDDSAIADAPTPPTLTDETKPQ